MTGCLEILKFRFKSAFGNRPYKRILVTFAGFKHYIGFYPTPSAIKAFAKKLAKYKTATGSIQFPLEKPLPLTLIRQITAFRVKESIQEDKKWRTNN